MLVNWQEHVEDEMKKELAHNAPEDDEEFGTGRCAGYQRFLWDLMEKPWTSNAAQYYAVASLFVVGVSTLTFVLSTMEDAKSEDSGEEANPFLLTAINITGKMNLNYF